jgi:hypothetical protein
MANWLADVAPYLALHGADPGETGANETTASRVAAGWSAATGGGNLTIPGKTFTGGTPNGPVLYLGLWSAPTGGLFYGAGLLTGDVAFNPNGSYNLTSLVIRPVTPG